jgi:hypothetical protein
VFLRDVVRRQHCHQQVVQQDLQRHSQLFIQLSSPLQTQQVFQVDRLAKILPVLQVLLQVEAHHLILAAPQVVHLVVHQEEVHLLHQVVHQVEVHLVLQVAILAVIPPVLQVDHLVYHPVQYLLLHQVHHLLQPQQIIQLNQWHLQIVTLLLHQKLYHPSVCQVMKPWKHV